MPQMSRQAVLITIALALMIAPAYAQRDRDTYTGGPQAFEVAGEVKLRETGALAAGIPVRLERFSGGIVDQILTDNRGRFRFANLQRGYYKVFINAPGYRQAQQDADLQVVSRAYLVFEINSESSNSASGAALLTDVVDARIPANAREEFNSARASLNKKNYPDAISHLEKAIFAYPDFFDAQLLLGTTFMDIREWDKAEKALERALELKRNYSAVLIYLGEVYWRQKRYPDAEQTLKEGLKLDEKSWHGQFTLGRLYWDMGDVTKAAAPIGMTLQLKPDLAEAHLLGGNILLRVGQQQRALVEYREYLRLAPKGEFASQVQDLILKVEKSVAEKKSQ